MQSAASKDKDKGKGKGKGKGGGLPYMLEQAKHRVPAPSVKLRGRVLEWYCIDDFVMGGQSTSTVSVDANGCLQFQGTISTSGGGFCSCRTGEANLGIPSTARGLRVTYTCDTARYKLTLGTGSMSQADAPVELRDLIWSCPIPEGPGCQTVNLPFDSFKASVHGRPVSDAVFEALDVNSVGVNCSVFDIEGKMISGLLGGDFAFTLEKVEILESDQKEWMSCPCCSRS